MSRKNPSSGQALFDLLKSRMAIDENGCWIWQRGYHSNNPPCGHHGMVTILNKKVQTHRAMWIAGRAPNSLTQEIRRDT